MSDIPTARADAVDSSELGFTLPVELIVQESPEMGINWPDYSWASRPESERIPEVLAMLKGAKEVGVDTIMDRTIPGIARDVPRMKRIAEQTPVNILVMTGWYTRYEFEYYFRYREAYPHLFEGEMTLEDFMVRDIEEGILDTGVRAAAIKAVSDYHGIKETVDVGNVFRYCVRAQLRTGAPIYTHTNGARTGRVQQEAFIENGADMERVAYGHLDRTPTNVDGFDDFERLAQHGSYLSFDGWWGTGEPNPVSSYAATREENIDRVVRLVEAGYEDQLLLSNGNVAFTDCLPSSFVGEYAPYTQLTLDIIPALKERGVSDSQVRKMVQENPSRLLDRT